MRLSTFAPARGAILPLLGLVPLALPAAAQSVHEPGASVLSVHGKPLTAGGHADLQLKLAGANRPGILVVSPGQSPLSIFGGTLVPTISPVLIQYFTDAYGKFTLKDIPGGLGMFSMYVQCVTENLYAPEGAGISNAVRIDFLP